METELTTPAERQMREAWSAYAFARQSIAPGAGMQVRSEAETWSELSTATMAMFMEWNARETTVDKVITLIREDMDTANRLSESQAPPWPYGWASRAAECRELLRTIPGTPEYRQMHEDAKRLSVDL